MIRLIILDWNGTLLDDTEACMSADNEVLALYGGHTVDLHGYRQTLTVPKLEFYTSHGCDAELLREQIEEVSEVAHAHYNGRSAQCPLRTGAKELLAQCRADGREVVILSNHTLTGIHEALQRFEIAEYVARIIANEHRVGTFTQGKHERLQRYLASRDVAPHEMVLIGDAPEEVGIAREMGSRSIAVAGGAYAEWRLEAAQPDAIVRELVEVPEVLEGFMSGGFSKD